MSQDYYQILGVAKNASQDDMKKSYRKLAMQFHPDKNKGDKAAEEKFKKINEAYDVLKDEQKRAAYDRYGHSAFTNGGAGQGGAGQGGAGGGFHSHGFSNLNDLFEQMMRQAAGGGNSGFHDDGHFAHAYNQGSDIRYNLELSLEEAYAGKTSRLRFTTLVKCDPCNGFGGANGVKPVVCKTCNGRGQVRAQQAFFSVERTCQTCGGAGQVISDPCKSCQGQGRARKEKNLEVKIPAGVDEGMKIRVPGEGEAGVRGAPSGDLYVFISLKNHAVFKRNGSNIHCKVTIPMTQAALGAEIEVPAIDGERISMKIPAGTQHGYQHRVRQKGMPGVRSAFRGDMLVEVSVEVPVNLSKRQKELLEEFQLEAVEANNSPQSQGFFSKVKDFFGDFNL